MKMYFIYCLSHGSTHPKPLYYQFQAEHTGHFEWSYLETGPDVWRVRIGKK